MNTKTFSLLTILLVIVLCLSPGCGSRTEYVNVVGVAISPVAFSYKYDPTVGRAVRVDTAYDSMKVYAYDSIYWNISAVIDIIVRNTPGRLWPVTNCAYATTLNIDYIGLYKYKHTYIIAASDYNAAYSAGDTLNNIVKVARSNDTITLEEAVRHFINADDELSSHNLSFYMAEPPEDTLNFSFKVVYEYEDEVFYYNTSDTVKLY